MYRHPVHSSIRGAIRRISALEALGRHLRKLITAAPARQLLEKRCNGKAKSI
jgi:hypothetical protein